MTLKEMLEEHPEWADLPVAVARNDGNVDFIGDSGFVYDLDYTDDPNSDVEEAKARGETYKILVFVTN